MTPSRFALTVPAGSSLTFTGLDGVGLEHPMIGTLDRSISLHDSLGPEVTRSAL